MNFLDLVERLLVGVGFIGPAVVVLMTFAKLVQGVTKNQTDDWKAFFSELTGVVWLNVALLLVVLGIVVWAISSQVSWQLFGLALCLVATLWLGLEAFPHLRSKMQFPGWLGDVFFSSLLLGDQYSLSLKSMFLLRRHCCPANSDLEERWPPQCGQEMLAV